MNNMKKRILIIGLIVLIVVLVIVGVLVLFAKKDIDFIECVEDCSIEFYINEQFDKEGYYKRWEDEEGFSYSSYTYEIKPNLSMNYQNVELFSVLHLLGGGDSGRFNFFKFNKKCCRLNDENIKKLFTPIKTEEEAKQYYLFNKNLGGAFEYDKEIIFSEKDYNHAFEKGKIFGFECSEEDKEKLRGIYTTIKTDNGGFLLEVISFSQMYGIGFVKEQIKILKDGTIKKEDYQEITNCGIAEIVY